MTKQELKNEIIATWKAIKGMEECRSCWEMGDQDTYEKLVEEFKSLSAKFEE